MKKLFLQLLLIATLILHSCEINIDNTKVPVNTTLPLVDFQISDITLLSWAGLKDEVTKGNDDILEISRSIKMDIGTSEDFNSIFSIDNQNFSIPMKFGGTIPIPIEVNIDPRKLEQKFKLPQDYIIDNATLNGGELILSIENTISNFSKMSCVIDELTKNDIPLTIKPGERKLLKGYKLKFKDKDAAINFTLSGKISAKAGDNLSNVKINIAFSGLKILEAKGFFGRSVITPAEDHTIYIDNGVTDFFENCDYYLSNPQIALKLDNAYNLPALIQISKLKVGDTEIKLKKGVGSSMILLKPQQITEYVLSNLCTESGTGLSDAISKDLKSFTIGFTIITNPTKEDVGDNNYTAPVTNEISLSNTIKINETLSVPFSGMFTNIPFSQEFTLGLSENESVGTYDYLKLAVICNNQMPFNLKLNLVAISQDKTETALFEEPMDIPASNGLKPSSPNFKPGVIDENNIIIQSIAGDKVKLLMNSKSLRFEFKGSMPQIPGGEYSSLYTPSMLNIKLIGNLKGEF